MLVAVEVEPGVRYNMRRYAPVAQWIEQQFPKLRVARSIRVGGTTF
jgi:hypothetical protein